MRKDVKLLIFIVVLLPLLLASCATMGVPDSAQGKVNYANATLTGLNNAATDLINYDRMGLADAVNYQAMAQRTRELLDLAQADILAGHPSDAVESWMLANAILLELNQIIKGGMYNVKQ